MRKLSPQALANITNRACEIADVEAPGELGMVTVLLYADSAELAWANAADLPDLVMMMADHRVRQTIVDYFDGRSIDDNRVLLYFMDTADNSEAVGLIEFKSPDPQDKAWLN